MLLKHGMKSGTRSYALFDIGAASVGAALAIRTAEGDMVLWHTRLSYAYHSANDYTRYERAMYATLLEAGMSLTSEGVRRANEYPAFDIAGLTIICTFAPPWFLSSVGYETEGKEKPFTVTHGLLDTLRSRMVSTFLESSECQSWREVMGTPELIEQSETEVCLNGYRVSLYNERSTPKLSVRSYLAVVSESVRGQVQDIINRVLPNHTCIIRTSSRAIAAHLLTDEYTGTRRSVLVESGGQVTSMTLLDNGVLTRTAAIPFGTYHLLHAAAPKAASTAEARSALNLLVDQNTAGDGHLTIPTALVKPLTEWREALIQSLTVMMLGITPPRTVVLLAEPTWYQLYANILVQPTEDTTPESPLFDVFPYLGTQAASTQTTSLLEDVRIQAFLKAVDD